MNTVMLPDNRIRAVVVSSTEERRAVTGLIVSTDFCNEVIPKLYLEYFTNTYLRKVADWCVAFYTKYSAAPSRHIQDIYEDKKNKLDSVEADLISKLLVSLSDQYDESVSLNVDYLVESTINYFRKRELEIHKNNITVLLEDGRIDEAEQEVARFQAVTLGLDDSLYIDLGNIEQRKELYEKYESKQKDFFRMPGDLGDFIGNIKQGDVVGITAPAKRGKSFLLNDFMKHLILQRRKVVKFAIEMTDIEEITRFDKLFYPTVDKHKRRAVADEYGNEVGLSVEAKKYMYPCFDCVHNQTGECKDRESNVIVRDYGESMYNYVPEHKPCTKCRYDADNRDKFMVCAYLQPITREELNGTKIVQELDRHSKMLSKYARIVVRPKYSLTYDLMMYDLEAMYKKYNFIPQAILIDYIDIMLIDTQFADYRVEDEKWKLMQKLASATKCAVITPTQANKAGAESHTLRQTDQGGFYGKGRHVNLMLGINQTADEKAQGIYRVNILDGRSVQTNSEDFCMVLQDLKSGQMHLDSYWIGKNNYHF